MIFPSINAVRICILIYEHSFSQMLVCRMSIFDIKKNSRPPPGRGESFKAPVLRFLPRKKSLKILWDQLLGGLKDTPVNPLLKTLIRPCCISPQWCCHHPKPKTQFKHNKLITKQCQYPHRKKILFELV